MAGIRYGRQRQADIYFAGVRGRKPRVPQSAAALEQEAERAMSDEGFVYIAGGAGLETTMRANRAAFDRVRIVPRMLRGPATRKLETGLFGRTLSAALLLAPIGVLEMAHRDGDVAVARAAAAEGVPMIFPARHRSRSRNARRRWRQRRGGSSST